jgi:hypothetical protein
MGKFKKIFRRLADPRADNARHDLVEVLVIALAAMLCGADTCSDMAEFGQAKQGLLRLFLRLEHGIPSHDTFSRVFRLLKPEAFEAAFRRFMAAFAKANRLKISGVWPSMAKPCEASSRAASAPRRCAWSMSGRVEARMALAQQKAPGRNETAGALQVLDLLSLEGCIITADAAHCHRAMATRVLERGGDYWRSRPIGGLCSLPCWGSLPGPASAASPSNSSHPLTTGANCGTRQSCATPAWPLPLAAET